MDADESKRGCFERARAIISRHKVLSGLILLFLLPLGFVIAEHVRGSIMLHRYLRALRARGEKINAAESKLPPGTGENGAPEVVTAAKSLKPGVVLPQHYSPGMHLTVAGHAIVFFREEQWVEDKTTNTWNQLAQDLATNQNTLATIRVALAKPLLDSGFDPSLGSRARFEGLTVPKRLATWFGARVDLALHEGRTRDALDDLLTEIDLSRFLARDGIVISELVRIAIAAIARNATWQVLQAEGWTKADLARVQSAWEQTEFVNAMVRAFEGERIFAQSTYAQMRQSNQETVGLFFAMDEFAAPDELPWWERAVGALPGGKALADFIKKQLYCRFWRFAWLDQDEARYLHYLQGLIELSRDSVREKSFMAIEPRLERLALDFQNHGWYDRLRYSSAMSVDSLSRVLTRTLRGGTDRSLVIAALALKRFALRHGGPPAALNDLVPEFLRAVPVDYMDGKPLKYRRYPEGTYVLYSIGEDGHNDGGDPGLRPGKTNLRIPWDRKDVVWPAPATTNEVQLYRSEQLRSDN